MGSEVEQLNTIYAQVYAKMSLIELIYIDFTVFAAAATVVNRLQNPPSSFIFKQRRPCLLFLKKTSTDIIYYSIFREA